MSFALPTLIAISLLSQPVDVPIDTRRGTWMNIAVSPDGKSLVFDLLGDLYHLPMGGGDATALTGGSEWDMQPRFSPDGRTIAFTSDRGGGDNLWVMGRDGKDARQITKEDFRLVTAPAWTPDGRFLIGRKHFTSRRSLGAGELWLYHVGAGGKGVQLFKRPNDQKDVGEPAVSPDGRYVYYSRDATPGDVFEYNKDPHKGIYSVFRFDRQLGQTVQLTGGPGGAVRPTPSPDGKWVAFVRRVGARTVLWLHNTTSGEERPIFDRLDRDMQETWAIHGVYPSMDWTPDSNQVVLWANGRIWRVALTGEAYEIPFHVKGTRTVQPAVRFAVDVAPAQFAVRALRGARVSPAGDKVAYSALGRIWVRTLPEGKPKRLTSTSHRFEFMPSWSPDGKRLVYVTWSDLELGQVVATRVRGGRSTVLTAQKGHYVEPTFTPDGASVVYRRVTGGYLRTQAWSKDPGIYIQAAKKGAPAKLVTRDGSDPHFGARADRLFVHRRAKKKHSLVSLSLAGQDELTHATNEFATRFQVSPDGRWLAWAEGYRAHVMAFTDVGAPIAVGSKSEALPTAAVSRDSAYALHFSGDSATLHWTRGPQLLSAKVRPFFPALSGAEKAAEPPATGVEIGFERASDVPDQTLALIHARVVTMKGDQVLDSGTVLIKKNRIVAVGKTVAIEPGTRVVDLKGKTIIPGLVDVHAHGGQAQDGITPQVNWKNLATLALGVTTIHDPSNPTESIFSASDMQRVGAVLAPRIYSTGTILYGAKAEIFAAVNELADAESHLRRLKAFGAISVKSYNQPRRDQRLMVLKAARKHGMMVVPEGGSLFQHNMTMVVDGHTGIEHALPIATGYSDVVQLWKGTQVGYTPTLVVAYGGIFGENLMYQQTEVWKHPLLTKYTPRWELRARSRRREMAADDDWNVRQVARFAKELMEAGVRVNVGGHGQREGLGSHWEMWLLVEGGWSPHQALRAGTFNGAWYLGLDKDLGSLEPGKLADMVVLDKNPLDDIRNSDDVHMVIQNGRIYDAATMNEVHSGDRKRGPLFFERYAR